MCLALAMVMIIIFPFQCPSSFLTVHSQMRWEWRRSCWILIWLTVWKNNPLALKHILFSLLLQCRIKDNVNCFLNISTLIHLERQTETKDSTYISPFTFLFLHIECITPLLTGTDHSPMRHVSPWCYISLYRVYRVTEIQEQSICSYSVISIK